MNIESALRAIGLTETEAKIYFALLKEKESTAVSLSKKIAIHRRTIYDNLSLLQRKGMVGVKIKNGISFFSATNPDSLGFFIEERKKILATALPTLQQFYKNHIMTPTITVFSGVESAKALIEEAVLSREKGFWMSGGGFLFERFGFSRKFIEQKAESLKIKVLKPLSLESETYARITKKENMRILPKSFISRTGYLVYGDTVIIGIIQESEVTSIKIVSEDCAHAFKNYFMGLWSIAKTN